MRPCSYWLHSTVGVRNLYATGVNRRCGARREAIACVSPHFSCEIAARIAHPVQRSAPLLAAAARPETRAEAEVKVAEIGHRVG